MQDKPHAVRGSTQTLSAPLPTLDSPSSLHLEVERWFDKPARLARMDRLSALALVAADGALVAAGLSTLVPDRTGVVLGTSYGCHATNEAYDASARSGVASPRLFAYTLPSSAVGEISIHLVITGPVSTVVSGLTAGLDALREAARHLDAGRAERMIVVAADVVTPTLARLRDASLPRAERDAACALVLDADSSALSVRRSVSRFCAGDPTRAARRCLEALGPLDVASSIAPAGLALDLPGQRRDLDETLLAAAPLAAVHALRGSALVLATDPSGQASAVVVA